MISTKAAIAAAIAIAVVGGAMWITYAWPVVFCALLQEDSMDAAFCGTYEMLRDYEDRPEEAVAWLLAYHGEAPGSQVMFTLADWATQNQDHFIDILSRLEDEDVQTFIERLAGAIRQSAQLDEFTKAFAAREDENARLGLILERIEALRP